jgi:capsular polysaccharide biosynthesis protein
MLFVKLGSITKLLIGLLRKKKIRKLLIQLLTHKFGLKIVTREQLENNPKYQTLLFGSEELIIHQPHPYLQETPKSIQPRLGQVVRLPQPFVSELKSGQIVGSTAAVFDEDKHIVEEPLPDIEDLPVRALIAQKLFIANTPKLDTVCSLVHAASHVYGHWIADCLMRLEGVEHYQEMTGRKPILIVNSNLRPWQIDSLKLLGYGSDDYIQWKWNLKGFNVERLVVPSFRRHGTWIDPSACRWLKQRMLSNLPPIEKLDLPLSRRIYISRKKEAGRRVMNEDEVMQILQPLGFISYNLETINFIDEVRLFSQAEIIIGTHGSGLTNMIFSQKQPMIIDLFSSWYTPWFSNLSTSLGCQYIGLQCQPSGKAFKVTRGNMIVDVAKLEQLVRRAILEHKQIDSAINMTDNYQQLSNERQIIKTDR